jgi:hypothetical protein
LDPTRSRKKKNRRRLSARATQEDRRHAGLPIKVDVPLVNLDVLVTAKDGLPVPGLHQENFKILEDGAEQKVSNLPSRETRHHCRAAGGMLPPTIHS